MHGCQGFEMGGDDGYKGGARGSRSDEPAWFRVVVATTQSHTCRKRVQNQMHTAHTGEGSWGDVSSWPVPRSASWFGWGPERLK